MWFEHIVPQELGTRGSTASLCATASPEKQQRIKHPTVPSSAPENNIAAKRCCRTPRKKKHLLVLCTPRGTHRVLRSCWNKAQHAVPTAAGWPGPSYPGSGSAHQEAAFPSYQSLGRAIRCPGSCAGTANKPLARTKGRAGPQLGRTKSKSQPGLQQPSTKTPLFLFIFFLFQHSSAWLQFSEEQIGTFIGHSFLLQPAAA